jgi:hypothetical protein
MVDLLDNPLFDEAPQGQIPTATHQIYNFIGEYLSRAPDTHINRASSASLCHRRRWYKKNGYQETPLTPRKMINFALGDLTEKMVQYFIKEACVGPGKLYSMVDFGKPIGKFTIQGKEIIVYDQEDLTAQIGDITVTAHIDGYGQRNSDGKFELIEIKSSSDWGFKDFINVGPKDYTKQAHVNMKTKKLIDLGVQQTRFYFLKKSTGHIYDRLINFDQQIFNKVVEEYKLANQEQIPERPYTISSKGTLQFPCNYCSFIPNCWPNFELQFKSEKPVYVQKQEKDLL